MPADPGIAGSRRRLAVTAPGSLPVRALARVRLRPVSRSKSPFAGAPAADGFAHRRRLSAQWRTRSTVRAEPADRRVDGQQQGRRGAGGLPNAGRPGVCGCRRSRRAGRLPTTGRRRPGTLSSGSKRHRRKRDDGQRLDAEQGAGSARWRSHPRRWPTTARPPATSSPDPRRRARGKKRTGSFAVEQHPLQVAVGTGGRRRTDSARRPGRAGEPAPSRPWLPSYGTPAERLSRPPGSTFCRAPRLGAP